MVEVGFRVERDLRKKWVEAVEYGGEITGSGSKGY